MQESEIIENVRNSAKPFSTVESGFHFPVISDQQLTGVEDGRTEGLGCREVPVRNNQVSVEKWNAGHDTDQGTRGLCMDQGSIQENCEGQIFQDHCTAANNELTETNFEPACQFD
ncbi:hypothetical protein JD844_002929 [Phrynosoma platyrhinos]|uniref:Uncharacterized protein n=1 Tax=Phrynosoma platyrhinos TaxID=52577 RepID=A0ABQ7TCA1_PHRPL|nr:hypothetical protein JD844_002929 [Phrynosoma platyrhinos]